MDKIHDLCTAAFQVTELEVLRRKLGEVDQQAAIVAYFFPELRETTEQSRKQMKKYGEKVEERENEIIQAIQNGKNPRKPPKLKVN